MKVKNFILRIGCLFLLIGFWMQPIEAYCKGLKSINVELESCNVVFSSKDNICLLPIFKIFNPNNKIGLVAIDYTMRIEGEILGSGQLPTVYLPSEKTIQQRECMMIEYKSWFAKLYFQGKSPGEALQVLLPLWKSLGGQEPAGLPEGMWSKFSATEPEIWIDGSITLVVEGEKERLFFFKSSVKGLEK